MTLDAYAAKAAPPLSDAWYVRLFAPREHRDRVTAVLAYAAEVEDCVRAAHEPAVTGLKLAWWREEIERLEGGAPRHPITLAVTSSNALRAARGVWLALLSAAQRNLERAPHSSLPDLEAHCADAGALHELLALALDADSDALVQARALGAATAYAALVCDAQRNAAAGRIDLPLDMLAAADLQRADLLAPWPARALELLARLGAAAHARLTASLTASGTTRSEALRAGAILAELRTTRLALLQSRGYEGTVVDVRPATRLWIAWRTARRFTVSS